RSFLTPSTSALSQGRLEQPFQVRSDVCVARILNGGIRAVARTDVRTSAAFAAAPGRPRSAATQDPLDPAECCARAAWRPRAGDRGSARLAAHRQRCREAGAV